MRKAERDPIQFAVRNWIGISGIPRKQSIKTRDLIKVLECWVGHQLDEEILPRDDVDEVLMRATKPPIQNATVHEVFETRRRLPHLNMRKNQLLSFKASPFDPIMALDRHLIALVARVYSRYYLSTLDDDKRHVESRRTGPLGLGGRAQARQVEELSRLGAHRFALNILARFGSVADLNSDGVISNEEANAIRNLIFVLPDVVDESKTPEARLVFAYNVACRSKTPATKRQVSRVGLPDQRLREAQSEEQPPEKDIIHFVSDEDVTNAPHEDTKNASSFENRR